MFTRVHYTFVDGKYGFPKFRSEDRAGLPKAKENEAEGSSCSFIHEIFDHHKLGRVGLKVEIAAGTTQAVVRRQTARTFCDRSIPTKEERDESPVSSQENSTGERAVHTLQVKDRLTGWTTVYLGYKTEVEIKSLKPGDCFQFRLKSAADGEESEWSSVLFAATKEEAIPVGHLFRAIENGNATNAKRIIAQRPAILKIPNKFSQTPIEAAISNNDANLVALLVNLGADVNGREIGSWRTPLMTAAYRGHLDIVKVLTEKGSSWEDKDRNGMTALHYAADNSHFEIVQFAVEEGADVKLRDVCGWSPLMRAVTVKASPRVIEYLLDHGGEVNETDPRNQTLLMQAVISGRPDVVRLIVSRRADVDRKNIYGHTAYDMAIASTSKEIRKIAHILGSEPDKSCHIKMRRTPVT